MRTYGSRRSTGLTAVYSTLVAKVEVVEMRDAETHRVIGMAAEVAHGTCTDVPPPCRK